MTSSRQRYRAFVSGAGVAADDVGDADSQEAGDGRAAETQAPHTGRPDGEPRRRADWRKRRGYLREYLAWLRPYCGKLISIYVIATAAALLGLLLPAATMRIIDQVIPSGDARLLHTYGVLLLVAILLQQALDLWRFWLNALLNAQVVFRLRQRLYSHLLGLPLHELWGMKTGGITSRVSGDVDATSGLVQMGIVTPAVALTKIGLTLGLVVWINWQMAVAALLLLPLIVGLNMTQVRKIRPIYRNVRRDRARIDARVVETFGGIRVVRAFGRERTEALRYALDHHTVIRKELRASLLEYLVWAGWGVIVPLAGLIIIWLGAMLVLKGQTTIGSIVAFQMYLLMLLMPTSLIIRTFGELQRSLAAMERVFDLLRRPMDKPDRPGARPAPGRVDTVEFDDVTFGYQPDRPILRHVSLRVRGGATVALVGPSGAGKTTLTNLVARFYDPDAGAVRLNGIDLRDLRLASYRGLLGLVQQDVFLFDGTIAENIAYGRPRASRRDIEDAARRANAHEFITAFPRGYETLVGERGVRLSGGQAQRVSIARALLADPRILILDEATSNLDSESEQLIQASLAELLADRTTFVIAHRLSTIMHADVIVVIDDGRVVETGTHAELMQRDTAYRAMVERQRRPAMADVLT
ncbi:MAG TPA: ABC transporter ATP-binding protein [Phycisphaerae bacterium]|nr:ABC transporter ATP-binding protein [Phycisphaerae bacterium]